MYRVTSPYNMYLRLTPSGTGALERNTTYPAGTVFIADALVPPASGGLTTDKWAHVVSVDGVAKDAYVAIVHNGSTLSQYSVITVPSTNPTATITFTDSQGKVWEGTVELKPK